MEQYLSGVFLLLLLWLAIGTWRLRKRRVIPGPGGAGMMHELFNEDRRAAVEIIVEERAAARDPETQDGQK